MSTAEDMASSSGILPPEQAARLADAMRPYTDAIDRLAENMRPVTDAMDRLAEAMRPVQDALAALPTVALPMGGFPASGFPASGFPGTPLPESVRRSARRWAAMSPRQRARALLAEVRRRAGNVARAYAASLRIAVGQTTANLAALYTVPRRAATDAHPCDGPPLALVLLDSTRPVHGPPLPA